MAGLAEPRPWTASYAADVAFVVGRPRVVMRDDTLDHQIRLSMDCNGIVVSCLCRQRRGLIGLDTRNRWEASEALAVYRAHLEE